MSPACNANILGPFSDVGISSKRHRPDFLRSSPRSAVIEAILLSQSLRSRISSRRLLTSNDGSSIAFGFRQNMRAPFINLRNLLFQATAFGVGNATPPAPGEKSMEATGARSWKQRKRLTHTSGRKPRSRFQEQIIF